jgi:hypothetical protein
MGLTETIVFYLLFGAGVAFAVALSGDDRSPARKSLEIVTAALFWPFYIPILLHTPQSYPQVDQSVDLTVSPDDNFAAAIDQVEAELDSALGSLDGWAENVLAGEQDRLSELRAAWRNQAERIREIDRILARPEFVASHDETAGDLFLETGAESDPVDHADGRERRLQSVRARQANIERLTAIRRQMHDDLLGTFAWVRELVTMIHLAKFTGAPASRAEELIAQIAAAVEGLSEVTDWREEPSLVAN